MKTKTKYGQVRIGPLSENGAPQRQAVGTFDVCLARPEVCPADIVRPHAAQLMIDTSVNEVCKIWPSADCLALQIGGSGRQVFQQYPLKNHLVKS